ncbi:MAG: septum formation family protein [Acidimicrobiia bacterium]|nr:septum formation family protein [Acidimicrobiia bacterium]
MLRLTVWRCAIGAAVLLAVASCTSDDGGAATTAVPGTSTTDAAMASSTTASATTTTTERVGRALVTPTTVEPIIAPPDDTTASGSMIPLDQLAAGDCVDLPGLGMLESITVEGGAQRRACDEPHGVEVYAVASLNDEPSAGYPGDGAVLGAADQLCLDAFEPYVGQKYVESTLDIVHLRPDADAWAGGDRVVHCAVHNRDLQPLAARVGGAEAG